MLFQDKAKHFSGLKINEKVEQLSVLIPLLIREENSDTISVNQKPRGRTWKLSSSHNPDDFI